MRGLGGADPKKTAAQAQLSRGTTKVYHAAPTHRPPHTREGAEHDMGESKMGKVHFKE